MPMQNESGYNPAKLSVSYKKFYQIRKMLGLSFSQKIYYDMKFELIATAMKFGDTQPAVVYSVKPFIVAAYSDEFDAVVFLSFPDELAETYKLEPGARLTTSNLYDAEGDMADDIIPGEGYTRRFTDLTPVVQLFFGKKDDKIKQNTELFDESVWDRVSEKAGEYAKTGKSRNGFFYCIKQK